MASLLKGSYFVYVLFDLDGSPRYVGASRYKYRLHKHEKAVSKEAPAVKVAEDLTQEEAYLLEEKLIEVIGRQPDGPLLNKATHINFGWEHKEDSKKRIRQTNKGQRRSQATKDKIRAYRTGRPHSEEHKRKVSETLKATALKKRMVAQEAARKKWLVPSSEQS